MAVTVINQQPIQTKSVEVQRELANIKRNQWEIPTIITVGGKYQHHPIQGKMTTFNKIL